MTESPGVRWALVVVSGLVLQVGLLSQLRVAGVAPDLPLLFAISAGLAAGPRRGAQVGFSAGLLHDLALAGTLGLWALTGCLTGYAAGRAQAGVLRAAWWLPGLFTAVGTAAGTALYVVVASLVGQVQVGAGEAAEVVAIVAVLNGVLGPLARRVAAWADPDTSRLRRDRRSPVLRT